MLPSQYLALAIFVLAYIFIIRFYEWKQWVVWAAVALLLVGRVISVEQGVTAINWNVILLYFGMLFVSEVFLYSRMPDYLASRFARKTSNTALAMLMICGFTSFLSIFLENVAVVLLVAPIALAISKECRLNPFHLFVGMAISSNLQGAGTLIGDPPSMLLGGFAHMSFNDFFFVMGKPSIFFAVQVGAIASLLVLYLFFRRHKHPLPHIRQEAYVSRVPTYLILGLIVSLILTSGLENGIPMAGLLSVFFGAASYGWYTRHSGNHHLGPYIRKLDWKTGVFLIGVFMLVESLSATGVISEMAKLITYLSGDSVALSFLLIVWLSVFFSAFIDNVPYLVVMLPVVQAVTDHLGTSPYLLMFGLLLGASVGGNITPIGASANIVAMGILKSHGFRPRFPDFVKVGLPFTIVATLASTAFVWIVFS